MSKPYQRTDNIELMLKNVIAFHDVDKYIKTLKEIMNSTGKKPENLNIDENSCEPLLADVIIIKRIK